ncbi:MAG TPA: dihydroneopterin aldolase [Candidatus Limnocylindrales bacterium]|nr:dihydroneopterin aldolase [Candidatus Limnocylindrales bacterium]
MDKIIVKKIVCYAFHGVLAEEQERGQEFHISFELGVDLSNVEDDNIENTTDYREAVVIVKELVYGKPRQLLETLASHISAKLLTLPGVLEATVEVCKPDPPIPGVQGGVSVVVTRRKECNQSADDVSEWLKI